MRQNIDFARLLSRARARGVLRRCLLLRAILLGEGVCALGEGVCALFMIEDHLFIQSSCTLLERLHLLEALAAHSAEDPRAHHASMASSAATAKKPALDAWQKREERQAHFFGPILRRFR